MSNKASSGCAAFLFMLLFIAGIVIYEILFSPYSSSDFEEDGYLARAEAGAVELVTEWQRSNWKPRGYIEEKQVFRNEPTFEVMQRNPTDEIEDRVEYLGTGEFHVLLETDTFLTSKFGDTVTVRESFLAKIKSPYQHGYLYRLIWGDDWKLVEVKELYKDPTLSELKGIIGKWSNRGE